MKAFRVRDIGNVEKGLAWRSMDGTAFVSVGGTARSYLTVSPALTRGAPEGTVETCDIVVPRPNELALIPLECCGSGCGGHDRRMTAALIVVPSGAYDFRVDPRRHLAVLPRAGNVALTVILDAGESIDAYPRVTRLTDEHKPVRLSFDGRDVTFGPITE